ncbi:MAG: four helix bundle protein [Ignavibacteriae bacterium]|nr:four helix bundle protein [Ignavibacteriota bacterium]
MFKKLEELEVYQLAEKLADEVWDICVSWESFAKFTVGKQLVNAADSIPANLSEGHGRFSMKENLQFCYYARGSFGETRNWLRRAYKRKLLTKKQVDILKKIMDELGPKLNAYITSIKRQSKQ